MSNRGHIYPNSIDENPDFQRTYPIEGLFQTRNWQNYLFFLSMHTGKFFHHVNGIYKKKNQIEAKIALITKTALISKMAVNSCQKGTFFQKDSDDI